MSEERLAYDNHILTREIDRRGDPSRDPCERIGHELDQAQTRIADLEAQNEALRTVVAAWGKDNETGTLTLQDALDAVAVLKSAREVYAGSDVTLTGNEARDALVRATAGIVRDQRVLELERREALWDAFALRYDWWAQWCAECDREGCAAPERLWDLVPAINEARRALDWKPVVWIEPTDDDVEVDAQS